AIGSGTGFGARLCPSAQLRASVLDYSEDDSAVDLYFHFHCRSRGTFLSCVGAESAGTACRKKSGAGGYGGIVWPLPFQQTFDALQLALRHTGQHRRDLLRSGMARRTASAG